MRAFFFTLAGVWIALVGAAWVVIALVGGPGGGGDLVKVYTDSMRTPLFSAFITLGGFLLTLKTAIIQRLKEAYEHSTYRERYKILKQTQPGIRYYGSLERLSLALATNVVLSLTTSALQMTVGFVKAPWSVGLCVGTAITTLVLLFYLTVQLFLAHRDWFHKIEEEKQADLFGS